MDPSIHIKHSLSISWDASGVSCLFLICWQKGNHDQANCRIIPMLATARKWGKHDDVIKWKHFPRYWPLMRGIRRSQSPVKQSFDIFFDLRVDKRLSKQSVHRWFETPLRPLCRHCNDALHQTTTKHNKLGFVCTFLGMYVYWSLVFKI